MCRRICNVYYPQRIKSLQKIQSEVLNEEKKKKDEETICDYSKIDVCIFKFQIAVTVFRREKGKALCKWND